VKGILADNNIQGYVDHLIKLVQAEPWKLFWEHLHLDHIHFQEVGLFEDSPDALVWHTCQQRELILVTDNRNKKRSDSLEATIQTHNSITSLPVFTIANVQSFRQSRDYANRVIEKFLDQLMRIDTLRGTGRLYLP
jgi:hypothetical protein